MPGAPDFAQVRSLKLCPAPWLALLLVLVATGVQAQERRMSFDMPAQSLPAALVEFARLTGAAVLIDGELAGDQQSSPVKGTLPAPDALRILLAGTGLAFRQGNARTFTVGLPQPEWDELNRSGRRAVYTAYFAHVQTAVTDVLCREQDTSPGRYRMALQLWIGKSGAVQALHVLSWTGDRARDATIMGSLERLVVAPPPAALPQPVALVLQHQPSRANAGCSGSSGPPS